MSYDYSNLESLFQQYAYNAVRNSLNKDQLPDSALFKAADLNHDGKVDSKDKALIADKVKDANKNKTALYDVNGDGKLTYDDLAKFAEAQDLDGDGKISDEELAKFAKMQDLDGDGKVSDAEKAFMKTQKEALEDQLISDLKKNKNKLTIFDFTNFEEAKAGMSETEKASLAEYEKQLMDYINKSTNFDVNSDGKVNANDYQEFLTLTKGKFDNASDTVKDFLAKYQKRIATKVFDAVDNDKLGYGDLAKIANRVDVAEKYLKDGKAMTKEQLKTYDMDNDGDFDADDVANLKKALSNYMEYLGIKDADANGKLDAKDMLKINDDYNTTKKALDTATDNLTKLNNDKKAADTKKGYVDDIVNKDAEITQLNTDLNTLLDELSKTTSSSKRQDLNQQIAAKRRAITKANTELAELKDKFKKKYPKDKTTDFKTLQSTIAAELNVLNGDGEGSIKAATTAKETANKNYTDAKTVYDSVKGIKTFIKNYKG